MKAIFDKLRQLSGGTLTQRQVDAVNRIAAKAGQADLGIMLGIGGQMTIGQKGIDLIKSFEGCKLDAYKDAVGVVTIGYGHTKTAQMGQRITQAQADELLRSDIATFESAVTAAVTVPINQNQFDALVCFAFNVGAGALRDSTLLKKLNAGDYQGAANEFLKWDKAGGKVLAGLTRRRKSERLLFLS